MKKSKGRPTRKELLRRRKIRKWWADHPEAKVKQSEFQKKRFATNPELGAQQGVRAAKMWTNQKTAAQIIASGKKSWTRKRRKEKSALLKQARENPKFEVARLAGIERSKADPDLKKRRRANLKKLRADPEKEARRKANSKKTTTTRKYRARMSTRKTEEWDKIRAERAALAKIIRTRHGGRPRKDETYKKAAALRQLDKRKWPWPKLAETEFPAEFAEDPKRTVGRVRKGVGTILRRSHNEEAPTDEP